MHEPPVASAAEPAPKPAKLTADQRKQRLQELAEREGGAALLAELVQLPEDDEHGAAFAYQKHVFDLVAALNDPGAADALAAYAASKPHVYLETRAALALGALGDLRAVPYLAHRLRLDPLETYRDVEWEAPLKRDDGERVASARLLGDLAILHPEALARATNGLLGQRSSRVTDAQRRRVGGGSAEFTSAEGGGACC